MHAHHATNASGLAHADPADTLVTGLSTWRALVIDLPLRITAETMRFTSRRLQAQADHLAALTRCGSLESAVALQAEFVTKGVSEYQKEATSLSHDVTEVAFAKVA